MSRSIRLSQLVLAVLLATSAVAFAYTIDLTAPGSSGSYDPVVGSMAYFYQADPAPTGTGNIQSFVRLKPNGSDTYEQGYNTDFRPLQFDENNSPQFTRSLNLGNVPIVELFQGQLFYEFLLDINQENADPLLSLVRLQIWLRSAPDLAGYDDTSHSFGSGSNLIWDFGEGNRIDLDYTNDAGSGKGDMFAYFPVSDFSGYSNNWVYLYSAFGGPSVHPCGGKNQPACISEPPYQANAGFEEWAIRTASDPVPEPSTSLLLASGFIAAGILARKKRSK